MTNKLVQHQPSVSYVLSLMSGALHDETIFESSLFHKNEFLKVDDSHVT